MQYVVRTDEMSSRVTGERTDLWLLTWDSSAGAYSGATGGAGSPTAEVDYVTIWTVWYRTHLTITEAHSCKPVSHREIIRWDWG